MFKDIFDFYLVRVTEIEYCFAEFVADFLKEICVEVEVCIFSVVGATEGSFEGVGIGDAEFFPSDNSCGRFF